MDEFWRLLGDSAFEELRKMVPDVAKIERGHVFGHSERQRRSCKSNQPDAGEQTPTKVFFPNGEANRQDTQKDSVSPSGSSES